MRKGWTGSTLKIIAVISMLIDHAGQILLKQGVILQAPRAMFDDRQFSLLLSAAETAHVIGRIAFPIFCFLLVEGFLHTRDWKKYLCQLGGFAVLSEPVYDRAFSGTWFSLDQQNVLFTLGLGLCVLALLRKSGNAPLPAVAVTAVGAYVSYVCHLDGWYYGILLMVVFYLFRGKGWMKYGMAGGVMYLCGLDLSLRALADPYFLTALSSLALIGRYNGARGLKMKYGFYLFYPAHLLALTAIAAWGIAPAMGL